jgi:hypothetical protein
MTRRRMSNWSSSATCPRRTAGRTLGTRYAAQERIGDKARNELLEEVVAFANAYGGDLIVGIGETTAKPPRAATKHPLPACADLAHRLDLAARDCIEPPLPRLEVRGVLVHAGGAGYVVIRTTKSAVGPHRLKPTLECYRRSAARSQRMTMREIQDHTLAMARTFDQVEAEFAVERQRFAAAMGDSLLRGVHGRVGLRATAIPGHTDVGMSNVHGIDGVRPSKCDWTLRGDRINAQTLGHLLRQAPWRLVLRGTESRTLAGEGNESLVRLGCDGTPTYQVFMDWRPDELLEL